MDFIHVAEFNNLYSELTNHGIDKERLIFAEDMNLDDYLTRNSSADLLFDTFNAATIANFALSSDLQVINLLGKSYYARIVQV